RARRAGRARGAARESAPAESRRDGQQRADLRRQALAWWQADLAQRTRLLAGGKSVDRRVTIWQTERALASVRDPAGLAKLPDAERQQWGRFWADAAALLAADPLEQGRFHAARRRWDQAAGGHARSVTPGQSN